MSRMLGRSATELLRCRLIERPGGAGFRGAIIADNDSADSLWGGDVGVRGGRSRRSGPGPLEGCDIPRRTCYIGPVRR